MKNKERKLIDAAKSLAYLPEDQFKEFVKEIMTTKKHTADYKARLKEKGLVRLELWVYPELKEQLKKYAHKLMNKVKK